MRQTQARKLSLRFGNGRGNGRWHPAHAGTALLTVPSDHSPRHGTDSVDRRRRVGDRGPDLVDDHPSALYELVGWFRAPLDTWPAPPEFR